MEFLLFHLCTVLSGYEKFLVKQLCIDGFCSWFSSDLLNWINLDRSNLEKKHPFNAQMRPYTCCGSFFNCVCFDKTTWHNKKPSTVCFRSINCVFTKITMVGFMVLPGLPRYSWGFGTYSRQFFRVPRQYYAAIGLVLLNWLDPDWTRARAYLLSTIVVSFFIVYVRVLHS